jgi:hypothetical protein
MLTTASNAPIDFIPIFVSNAVNANAAADEDEHVLVRVKEHPTVNCNKCEEGLMKT